MVTNRVMMLSGRNGMELMCSLKTSLYEEGWRREGVAKGGLVAGTA